MSAGNPTSIEASLWEDELRRMLGEVAAMAPDDMAAMGSALHRAVLAINHGFAQQALDSVERACESVAIGAIKNAANSSAHVAASSKRHQVLTRVSRAAAPPLCPPSRPFQPKIQEGRYDSMVGVMHVRGVVSAAVMRDIRAEVLSFANYGKSHRRLLIDFSGAIFGLNGREWEQFSQSLLAAQSTHLQMGYLVPDQAAYEQIERLTSKGVSRGQVNLVWRRRDDASRWLAVL